MHIKGDMLQRLTNAFQQFEAAMTTKVRKRSQRLSRGREILLIKKAHETAMLYDVDVALFLRIYRSGRLITYKSIICQFVATH